MEKTLDDWLSDYAQPADQQVITQRQGDGKTLDDWLSGYATPAEPQVQAEEQNNGRTLDDWLSGYAKPAETQPPATEIQPQPTEIPQEFTPEGLFATHGAERSKYLSTLTPEQKSQYKDWLVERNRQFQENMRKQDVQDIVNRGSGIGELVGSTIQMAASVPTKIATGAVNLAMIPARIAGAMGWTNATKIANDVLGFTKKIEAGAMDIGGDVAEFIGAERLSKEGEKISDLFSTSAAMLYGGGKISGKLAEKLVVEKGLNPLVARSITNAMYSGAVTASQGGSAKDVAFSSLLGAMSAPTAKVGDQFKSLGAQVAGEMLADAGVSYLVESAQKGKLVSASEFLNPRNLWFLFQGTIDRFGNHGKAVVPDIAKNAVENQKIVPDDGDTPDAIAQKFFERYPQEAIDIASKSLVAEAQRQIDETATPVEKTTPKTFNQRFEALRDSTSVYSKEAMQQAFKWTPEKADSFDTIALATGLDLNRIYVGEGDPFVTKNMTALEDKSIVIKKPTGETVKIPPSKAQHVFRKTAETSESIIIAIKNPSLSSGLPGLAHAARRFLFDPEMPPETRLGITDEQIKIAEKWCGAESGNWNKPAEEKFARGFERYMYDGNAPSKSIGGVFGTIKNWMSDIFNGFAFKKIDLEISPEMRSVYDALLTRRERITPPDPKATNPDVMNAGLNQKIQTPLGVDNAALDTVPNQISLALRNAGLEKPSETKIVMTETRQTTEKRTGVEVTEKVERSGVDLEREELNCHGIIDKLFGQLGSSQKVIDYLTSDEAKRVYDLSQEGRDRASKMSTALETNQHTKALMRDNTNVRNQINDHLSIYASKGAEVMRARIATIHDGKVELSRQNFFEPKKIAGDDRKPIEIIKAKKNREKRDDMVGTAKRFFDKAIQLVDKISLDDVTQKIPTIRKESLSAFVKKFYGQEFDVRRKMSEELVDRFDLTADEAVKLEQAIVDKLGPVMDKGAMEYAKIIAAQIGKSGSRSHLDQIVDALKRGAFNNSDAEALILDTAKWGQFGPKERAQYIKLIEAAKQPNLDAKQQKEAARNAAIYLLSFDPYGSKYGKEWYYSAGMLSNPPIFSKNITGSIEHLALGGVNRFFKRLIYATFKPEGKHAEAISKRGGGYTRAISRGASDLTKSVAEATRGEDISAKDVIFEKVKQWRIGEVIKEKRGLSATPEQIEGYIGAQRGTMIDPDVAAASNISPTEVKIFKAQEAAGVAEAEGKPLESLYQKGLANFLKIGRIGKIVSSAPDTAFSRPKMMAAIEEGLRNHFYEGIKQKMYAESHRFTGVTKKDHQFIADQMVKIAEDFADPRIDADEFTNRHGDFISHDQMRNIFADGFLAGTDVSYTSITKASETLTKWKQTLNKVGFFNIPVLRSMPIIGDLGLGDTMMSFVGFTGRMASFAKRYSPVGAVSEVYKGIRSGKMDYDLLSQGMTGTLLYASMGVISNLGCYFGKPKDENERLQWERLGIKWNSINWAGLTRGLLTYASELVMPDEEGDNRSTWEKAVAAASPVAGDTRSFLSLDYLPMASATCKVFQKVRGLKPPGKGRTFTDFAADTGMSAVSSIMEVFDNPANQMMSKAIQSYQSVTKYGKSARQTMSNFLIDIGITPIAQAYSPAIISSFARAIDGTARDTKANESEWAMVGAKFLERIPIARQLLEERLGLDGEAIKYYGKNENKYLAGALSFVFGEALSGQNVDDRSTLYLMKLNRLADDDDAPIDLSGQKISTLGPLPISKRYEQYEKAVKGTDKEITPEQAKNSIAYYRMKLSREFDEIVNKDNFNKMSAAQQLSLFKIAQKRIMDEITRKIGPEIKLNNSLRRRAQRSADYRLWKEKGIQTD